MRRRPPEKLLKGPGSEALRGTFKKGKVGATNPGRRAESDLLEK